MHQSSRYFRAALAGWLAGMALNVLPTTFYTIAIAIIAALLLTLLRHPRPRFGLLIFVAFLSANLYQSFIVRQRTPRIEYENTQQLWVTILDKPTKDQAWSKYLARAPSGWYLSIGWPRTTEITPGTDVLIEATLQRATISDDPVAALRVAKNHIAARAYNPTIVSRRPADLNWWETALVRSRIQFDHTIQKMFAEPSGALFAGIVAGLKSDLPSNLLDAFKTTGLSHIIAVSGFNITIVMDLFTRFSQRFGRKVNFILSWVAVLFFIFFTGATASVVRAGILAGLFVMARTVGRKASILRLLMITATVMTLLNPLILRYDIGFQLSFMAVIGLVLLAPRIEGLLAPLNLPPWLAETLSATTAAQITTLPIIVHYFNTLSLYSLPANVLVGPLIPLLTIGGIPLVLIVSALPSLAWLSYPFDLALHYIVWIVGLLADLPAAQLTLPTLPVTVWLYYYATISIWSLTLEPANHER